MIRVAAGKGIIMSTLRGVLLLGGVVAAGAVAYTIYKKQKSQEVPQAPKTVKVAVAIPQIGKKTAKKRK